MAAGPLPLCPWCRPRALHLVHSTVLLSKRSGGTRLEFLKAMVCRKPACGAVACRSRRPCAHLATSSVSETGNLVRQWSDRCGGKHCNLRVWQQFLM
jgi:hypothetical protein